MPFIDYGAPAFSIMTISIMALGMKGLFLTLSIHDKYAA
jgi:hypothetical protein